MDPAAAAARVLRAGTGRRPRGRRLPLRVERPLVPAAGLMAAASPYVELHAHSAFSFLDGASTPAELALAAADHGYPALALTDHDGIWGSREFAESCKRPGAAGDHRRGADLGPVVGTAGPPHPAGRKHGRVPQPLPAADRRARPHPRQHRAQRRTAVGDAGAAGGARRGARLPLRLRPRRGPGGRLGAGRNGGRRAAGQAPARRFRPRALPGRAAAALLAPRPRPQPLARPARRPPRRPLRGDRQRPLPQPPPHPPAGRLRRDRARADAGGVGAAAARQPQLGARLPGGRWPRASPSTRRRSPRRCEWPSGSSST